MTLDELKERHNHVNTLILELSVRLKDDKHQYLLHGTQRGRGYRAGLECELAEAYLEKERIIQELNSKKRIAKAIKASTFKTAITEILGSMGLFPLVREAEKLSNQRAADVFELNGDLCEDDAERRILALLKKRYEV